MKNNWKENATMLILSVLSALAALGSESHSVTHVMKLFHNQKTNTYLIS